ncbi:IucA/IucC family protein [Prauserella cavernicola]|uniref:Siderophore staphylobactin biosynthesis protein SbnC n=1 Tax=Prauserella cavernicola TaxID=2800127 RepID=A0A934QRL2_9PSEU|nr:IucA/IucC family protein [Prauserella cavernicola]MBK1785285.1 siderophore staphylobactin biosynthesis protein SbnC [Prauserella cavernicola]
MPEPLLTAREEVTRDLVDALIRERLFGFGDGTIEGEWYRVGDVRVRVREGDGLTPVRFAGGPVLHGSAELGPDELVRLVARGETCAEQVAADVRTAIEHGAVAAVPPHTGALGMLAGERLAASRNRPFHPTARAAAGWSAAELARYGTTRAEPLALDWVAVRTESLRFGSGERDLAGLLLGDAAPAAPDGFHAVPVHPWQREHVLPREFADELARGDIRPLATGLGAFRPTSSLRTLAAPEQSLHVKLPLGIATLGAARLLPPRYLDNGERAERTLRDVLARDAELASLVAVCDERSWCGWAGDEFADRPGHLAAQLRTYPADVADAVPMGAFAAPALHAGWECDPVPFFRALAESFCAVALGFLRYGVLPELHGQNVAVTLVDGVPGRFVLRDHDTVRIHPQWMRAAGVAEPGYRVKPGARQSLVLDEPGELVGYLQTLGLQVNLHGIADALSRHYGITENVLWNQLRAALISCFDRTHPLPEVERLLLRSPTWPSRTVLGPLLRQGTSAGVSMPASTGRVPNPLLR